MFIFIDEYLLMEQKFAICWVAIAPLRAAASDKAEITTQLLFGDTVEILERTEPWYRIRNHYDAYEGWLDFKQLSGITAEEYKNYSNTKDLVPAGVNNSLTAPDGSHYYLAASSSLPGYANGYCHIGNMPYKLGFEVQSTPQPFFEIRKLALFFLNAPYLWGGRTLFGIDCSGFVQAVFKLLGIALKRDASQQAEQGEVVNFLPEVREGDVAFFDNADGRIIHVGIMLSNNEIIHASGRVRIDPMDDQGIYNHELGRYSHQLRIIKRFI